ncbi:TPA: hypothetical protein ACXDT3_002197 [Clostridioides difficile]
MRYYERTTEMKKRRGIYSETDLYAYQQSFSYTSEPDWNYVGTFGRSNIKNISINQSTSIFLTTNNIYKIRYSDNSKATVTDLEMKQILDITFIKDPTINLTLSNISKGCTIDYNIEDNEPTQKFTVTEKLNGTVIATKPNSTGGNYSIVLTDEQILALQVNSRNNITIEISTEKGGLVTSKTVTFTRTNNKPTVLVNSYNSNTAKFMASDLDNNLSKIECYLDDVLKETITTDLTTEKTINYELTDNAIHTLKIVATDAEGATAEKILSISKEIMPLQSDATLQDISSKLVEIGEGFKNGKTSIINTLALKNIEASLNNTLVELSEKIKTSFDSSDASVQDLQNRITELNNQLSQRKKWASGIYTNTTKIIFNENPGIINVPINLDFIPSLVIVFFDISFYRDSSSEYTTVHSSNNKQETFSIRGTGETFTGDCKTIIKNISQSKFDIEFFRVDSRRDGYTRKEQIINWYAYQ